MSQGANGGNDRLLAAAFAKRAGSCLNQEGSIKRAESRGLAPASVRGVMSCCRTPVVYGIIIPYKEQQGPSYGVKQISSVWEGGPRSCRVDCTAVTCHSVHHSIRRDRAYSCHDLSGFMKTQALARPMGDRRTLHLLWCAACSAKPSDLPC